MQKFNPWLKTLILLIATLLIASAFYFSLTKKHPTAKLSVDQILHDHLQMRFQEVSKTPEVTLLLRDRLLPTFEASEVINLPYLNFILLPDDQPSINSKISNTIVYTDFHYKKALKDISPHKVIWYIESPKPHGKRFKFIQKEKNKKLFDKIYTCYRPLLELGDPYIYTPVEGTSANPDVDIDQVIQNKNKNLSIIASEKDWAPGHKLRHKVIERYKDKIDGIFGRKYNPVPTTSDALLNFRYCLVIENRKQDFYFSEKIIDALLCGTVPIYYGCPSIGKFFNADGIIQFDTIDELETILNNLSPEDYNSRLAAIKENFNTAHCYLHKDKYLRYELEKIGIIPTSSNQN